ncbi:MAG: hypothetical protein OEM96_00975 [Gemmatimonadota bacterium]|nr:hypothetical protein [Gemmatimonadota bacterium]
MNEILRKEIWRKLEGLPDDKAYQVLDYINFLRSRYSETDGTATPFQRFGELVQGTMRKGKVPARALRETMKVMGTADRVLGNLREAGREFLVELEGGRPEPSAPEPSRDPPESREIIVE